MLSGHEKAGGDLIPRFFMHKYFIDLKCERSQIFNDLKCERSQIFIDLKCERSQIFIDLKY